MIAVETYQTILPPVKAALPSIPQLEEFVPASKEAERDIEFEIRRP